MAHSLAITCMNVVYCISNKGSGYYTCPYYCAANQKYTCRNVSEVNVSKVVCANSFCQHEVSCFSVFQLHFIVAFQSKWEINWTDLNSTAQHQLACIIHSKQRTFVVSTQGLPTVHINLCCNSRLMMLAGFSPTKSDALYWLISAQTDDCNRQNS